MSHSPTTTEQGPDSPAAVASSTFRSFVAFAICLPTVIVLIDQLAFSTDGALLKYATRQQLFFPWTIAKTSLVTWCAGRLFGSSFYGWILLIWGVALVDIQTYGASHGLFGSSDVVNLTQTSISAQVGFLALWSILAHVAAAWRIAAAMAASTAIIVHGSQLSSDWANHSMPVVHTVATIIVVVLCLSLRLAGFRLQPIPTARDEVTGQRREVFQFGVKHMLIWTTALAPLLIVLKGIDWLVYRQLGVIDLFPTGLISACTAVVILATIWLMLGQGTVVLRLFLLPAAILTAGYTMYAKSAEYQLLFGAWPRQPVIRMTIMLGERWPLWFALVSGLLAAMLLFLRAAQFRLMKSTRGRSGAK